MVMHSRVNVVVIVFLVQHVVSLSLYIDVLELKLQMYFNLVLVEISQDCHVAVMLL